jgi:hypothetical protein
MEKPEECGILEAKREKNFKVINHMKTFQLAGVR